MLYFTAEYEDREKLLALGAKWDFARGQWYVDSVEDYKKFSDWIDGKIITDELYILEAEKLCPFCGKKTKLAAVACGEYFENFITQKFGKGFINILYGFENIFGGIAEWLKKRFPVKQRYGGAYGYKYLSNGCAHCGKLFADGYLFGDEDSPFYITDAAKAQKLKLYRAELAFDIALDGKIIWAFDKSLFKECLQLNATGLIL